MFFCRINVLTEPNTPQIDDNDSDSERVIFLGDDKPVILKPSGRSRGPSESKNKLQKIPAKGNNYLLS